MTITVRIPGPLRGVSGAAQLEVEATTVGQALLALDHVAPGSVERLLDHRGRLHRHVHVFVGDVDVRDLAGLATPLTPGDTVAIVPAVAGGSDAPRRVC